MHLSAAILEGGEGERITQGTYAGMARDLLTFKPGMGGCIAFVISWHDPRGKARRMRSAAAILAGNTTDLKKKTGSTFYCF